MEELSQMLEENIEAESVKALRLRMVDKTVRFLYQRANPEWRADL